MRIHNKVIGFNTLIIGSNKKAEILYKDLENEQKSSGHIILGFLNVDDKENHLLEKHIPHLGNFEQANYFRQMYEKGVHQYPLRKSGVRALAVPRI